MDGFRDEFFLRIYGRPMVFSEGGFLRKVWKRFGYRKSRKLAKRETHIFMKHGIRLDRTHLSVSFVPYGSLTQVPHFPMALRIPGIPGNPEKSNEPA